VGLVPRLEVLAEIRSRREQLRRLGRLPRRRRPPPQLQPDAIRTAYFGALLQVVARARELVEKRLVPRLPELVRQAGLARVDGTRLDETAPTSLDLNKLLDQVADEWFAELPNERLARLIEPYGRRTADFQLEQLAKEFKAVMGIDVFRSEPWLAPKIAAWTSENVALVKSIPTTFFDDLEKRLVRQLREGDRFEALAKTIQDRYGVAESSAKLVARDQVGKMYGELNRARQKNLGVTAFVWRTMRDNRVREEHEELEGERFTWDKPPAEGIPGTPIACRCWGEPDFDSLATELDEPAPKPEIGLVPPPVPEYPGAYGPFPFKPEEERAAAPAEPRAVQQNPPPGYVVPGPPAVPVDPLTGKAYVGTAPYLAPGYGAPPAAAAPPKPAKPPAAPKPKGPGYYVEPDGLLSANLTSTKPKGYVAIGTTESGTPIYALKAKLKEVKAQGLAGSGFIFQPGGTLTPYNHFLNKAPVGHKLVGKTPSGLPIWAPEQPPGASLPSLGPATPPAIPPPPAPARPAGPGPNTVEPLPVDRSEAWQVLGYEDAPSWHAQRAEAARQWRDALPANEKRAIGYYQGSGYHDVNGQLRQASLHDKAKIEFLSVAIDKAPPIERDVWVWRGMRYGELAQKPLEVLGRTGNLLVDEGFVSTSVHAQRSVSFAGSSTREAVLVHLRIPAGTKAPYLTGSGGSAYEYEILLQRGAEFDVKKVLKTTDGYTVLEAEYRGSRRRKLDRRDARADAKKKARPGVSKFTWTEDDFASGGVYFTKKSTL
jgi:SPP1 gp7 family putative phage head morphogenesis protein